MKDEIAKFKQFYFLPQCFHPNPSLFFQIMLTLYTTDTHFYVLLVGVFGKHCGKGEITHDEQFHLLSQCFLCYRKVPYTHKKWHHPCCYLGSIRDSIEIMPYGVKG